MSEFSQDYSTRESPVFHGIHPADIAHKFMLANMRDGLGRGPQVTVIPSSPKHSPNTLDSYTDIPAPMSRDDNQECITPVDAQGTSELWQWGGNNEPQQKGGSRRISHSRNNSAGSASGLDPGRAPVSRAHPRPVSADFGNSGTSLSRRPSDGFDTVMSSPHLPRREQRVSAALLLRGCPICTAPSDHTRPGGNECLLRCDICVGVGDAEVCRPS